MHLEYLPFLSKSKLAKSAETLVIAAQGAIHDSGILDLRLRGDDVIGEYCRRNHCLEKMKELIVQ